MIIHIPVWLIHGLIYGGILLVGAVIGIVLLCFAIAGATKGAVGRGLNW
jgi:hypothetical protein